MVETVLRVVDPTRMDGGMGISIWIKIEIYSEYQTSKYHGDINWDKQLVILNLTSAMGYKLGHAIGIYIYMYIYIYILNTRLYSTNKYISWECRGVKNDIACGN